MALLRRRLLLLAPAALAGLGACGCPADAPHEACAAAVALDPGASLGLLQKRRAAAPSNQSELAVRPCSLGLTRRCCGDGACEGPESAWNCAADCGEVASGPMKNPPSTGRSCNIVPASKPTVPTLCAPDNQGCCDCGTVRIQTYVFWTESGTAQRCFHAYNFPPGGAPARPVVLEMDGYSGGRKPSEFAGSDDNVAAEYYGFTRFTLGNPLQDGAGGFGLQFGNKNIANSADPLPCDTSDSREIEYLEQIFDFIGSNPELDSGKVYTLGFSQNSAFALYTAVCFADKVAGVLQGGTGMTRTGWYPVTPGYQGHCDFDSFAAHGMDCCKNDFCTTCQFWPLWPQTCSNKIFDCLFTYADDGIACGSDWHAYEAMRAEDNDARMFSFPVPEGDAIGGHKDVYNKWAWFAGCTGMVAQCSSTCQNSFEACICGSSAGPSHAKFAECEESLKAGSLSGCTVGCAPTIAMLMASEQPTISLSMGNFGQQTGLGVTVGEAPKPACRSGPSPIGTEAAAPPGPPAKCYSPPTWTEQPISPVDTCR